METEDSQEKVRIFTLGFILLSLVNICSFMAWQIIFTGLPIYLASLEASSVEVGLVSSLAMFGSIICRPFTGVLVDTYGRKGFLYAGYIVMALCSFCYAIFPIVGVIFATRFIHGLAWGFSSTAINTVSVDIFPRKRFSEAAGYYALTGSLALALGPAIAVWMAEGGHEQLMVVLAGVLTTAGILIAVVMFSRAYKEPPLKKDKTLRETMVPSNMFEKTAVFPSLIHGLLSMGYICMNTFGAIMGAERGIENMAALFITYAIANVAMRPILGHIADSKGFFVLGVMSCISCALSLVLLAYASTLWMIILAGIFTGLGMGTAMSVFYTMAVAIAPPDRRGAATSTHLFFFNGGMAVGPFIGGFLVDAFGYGGMYLTIAGLSVLTCIVFVLYGKERIDMYHTKQQG